MNEAQENSRPDVSALAICSLVLGLLSLSFVLSYLAIPGLICGYLAKRQLANQKSLLLGARCASTGIRLSVIGTFLFLLFSWPFVYKKVFMNEGAGSVESTSPEIQVTTE